MSIFRAVRPVIQEVCATCKALTLIVLALAGSATAQPQHRGGLLANPSGEGMSVANRDHRRPSPQRIGERILPTLRGRKELADVARHAQRLRQSLVVSKAASPPRIGDKATFFTRNLFDQDQFYAVEAVLLHATPSAYFWIAEHDLEWLGSASEAAADSLAYYFDEATPEHSLGPGMGSAALLKRYFGDFPDVDGDGKLDVLLLDIPDGFERTGGYVAGFFDPVNLTDLPYSNRRDLVYVDLYPTMFFEGRLRAREAAATLAHEAQHLIQAGYKTRARELTFINEGLSEWAEIACGFAPRSPEAYFGDPGRALLSWSYDDPIADYARASLWTHFLFEQVGAEYTRRLVQSTETGLQGIKNVLRTSGTSFETLFTAWGRALLVGDLAPREGYRHPDRRGLQWPSALTSGALPDVVTPLMEPLSHFPLRLPLVGDLRIRAADSLGRWPDGIAFSAARTHPDGSFLLQNEVQRAGGGIELRGSSRPHSSARLLVSDLREGENESGRPFDLLLTGHRGGRFSTLGYDDGLPDPFSDNASYLLLDRPGRAVALAFGAQEAAWLHAVSIKALFLSEIAGSGVAASAPRRVRLHVASYEDGRPGRPLTLPREHVLRRPFGDLRYETLSLEEDYAALSAVSDSFCIVIEPAVSEGATGTTEEAPLGASEASFTDAANYPAIAMDKTVPSGARTVGSAFYRPSPPSWKAMREVTVGNDILQGFRPMIRAHVVLAERRVLGEIDVQVSHDFRTARVTLSAPFPLDGVGSSVAARLPSGRFTMGTLENVSERVTEKTGSSSSLSTSFSYALPLEAGIYELDVRAVDASTGLAASETLTWTPGDAVVVGASYPNPSTGAFRIPLILMGEADVEVTVFDLLGRPVLQVPRRAAGPGRYVLPVEMEAPAGTYLLRVRVTMRGTRFTQVTTRPFVRLR